MSDTQSVPEPEFCLEEATIDELHQAITERVNDFETVQLGI